MMKKLFLLLFSFLFYFTNSYANGCTYSICTDDMICDMTGQAFGTAQINSIEIMLGCDTITLDESYNVTANNSNCNDCVFRFPYTNLIPGGHSFLEEDFNRWLIANNYNGNLSVSYNYQVDANCRGTFFEFAGVDMQILSITASEANSLNPCYLEPAQIFSLEESDCETETCECKYSFCPEDYGCRIFGILAGSPLSNDQIFNFPYHDMNILAADINTYLNGDGCASTQICEEIQEEFYDFTWEGCGSIDIDNLGNQAISYNVNSVCSDNPQGLLHVDPSGWTEGIDLKLNTADIKYFNLEMDFIVNENYAVLFRGRNNIIKVELRNGRIQYRVGNTTGMLDAFYPNGTLVKLRVSYNENDEVIINEVNNFISGPSIVTNITAENLFGFFMVVGEQLDGTGMPSLDNFKLTNIIPERLGIVIENTCTEFNSITTNCGDDFSINLFESEGDCAEIELDNSDNELSKRNNQSNIEIVKLKFQNPSPREIRIIVETNVNANLHAFSLTGGESNSSILQIGTNSINWNLTPGLNILFVENNGLIIETKKVMILD